MAASLIVADTNLIVYFLVRGIHTQQAEQVYRRDPLWLAPPLWRSEFCNVLALHGRLGTLPGAELYDILNKAERLMAEAQVSSREVLALALSSKCAAYDCEFVALAREVGAPLVTSDRLVLSRFPDTAVSPERFLSTGAR